jgi:citrate synthase
MPEASSGNGKVALRFGDGGELDLPVKAAMEGSAGIEVTKLLSTTGMVTLDPGFVNTAACSSEITYIDGDAGILRYRGYPIEQLAEKSSFLEVSYLLFYGALPTSEQLADFTEKVTHHTLLDEDFKTFFSAFSARTSTSGRSASPTSTRTTRCPWWRTSCG